MKIAHLDTGLELRGGQQQLLLLARGLRERGHGQLIVCPESSALEFRARQEGFRVFSLPAHDPARAHGILELRQLFLAEPFDILHAHDGRGQTISWLASLGMPVRRLASRRVTFLPSRLWMHRVKYTHTCHAVIAISNFVRQLLIECGVPATRIEVIPDGVEIPAALPDAATRARLREGWGLGGEEFVVGHLGAATPEKGRDIIIQTALLLGERAPEVRFVLATHASRPAAPFAARTVRVLAYPGSLTDFLAGLDLFIMPSRAEGLGSAAINAMAHGLAVVATRVGGLPELIEEGRTGWLVPPDSPEALAEAIVAALSDRARLTRYGAKAREQARQFSVAIMLERTESLYRRLAGRAAEKSKV